MRTALAIVFALVGSPAIAQTKNEQARLLGVMEWAQDNCGVKPDPERVKQYAKVALTNDLTAQVTVGRWQVDSMAKRHGKETACEAAKAALDKT